MSDSQTKLGQLIDGGQMRDAVHIAVAPVIAERKLYAGQDIGLVPNTIDRVTPVGYDDGVEMIGIVDPFLKDPVQPGQRFWMFLYPNTITALNHVWSHPAFMAAAAVMAEEEDDYQSCSC